ncbi:MAG: hypothetical protein O2856_01015 [Planctomycetota bacterium]|nr:hypothetical protein [Planctomycetota bacterium]
MLWAGWVLLTLLSSRFAWGVPGLDRPVLAVTLVLVALSIVHLYAVALVRKAESQGASREQEAESTISLKTIIGFALAMRFVAVFSTPIQELDYYRYMWDGETILAGANPFRITPELALAASHQNEHGNDAFNAVAELNSVAEVCRERPRVRETAARVHYGELPTIYPPVSLAVFAVATAVTPVSVSLDSAVVILRTFIVAFDVGIIFWLIKLLKHVRWKPQLVISYAWCPLVVKEFANSGHLDAIAVFFMLGSVTMLVSIVFQEKSAVAGNVAEAESRQLRDYASLLLSAVLLGLAIGAKLFPIILVPLLAGLVLRRIGLKAAVAWLATAGLLSIVCCWPMINCSETESASNGVDTSNLSHIPHPDESGLTNIPPVYTDVPPPVPNADENSSGSDAAVDVNLAHTDSFGDEIAQPSGTSPGNSLKVFLMSWKMNDFIFMLFESNLTPTSRQYQQRDQWFVLLPNRMRESISVLATSQLGMAPEFAPFLLSRGILSATFFALAMYWAWLGMSKHQPAEWLELAFLTVAWFWVLSPTLNPWYWTWAMPLMLFARNRAWHLLSAIVLVYYLRFWLAYQWGEQPVFGTRYLGEAFFHYVIVWAEHLPWMALLAWSAFSKRRKFHQHAGA